LWEGQYVDLNAADPSLPSSVRRLLALGSEGQRRAREALPKGTVRHDPKQCPLLAPVLSPQKIVCLGLNYRDHAIETGAPIPTEPVLFSKFSSALIGPGAEILLPEVSTEVDYEAELVVVIGRGGRKIPRERAFDHVAGYMVGHDVSARDWQLHKPGKQWLAGKTFDTFAPTGPELVTTDEVPDPHALGIRLRLNGKTMQDSNTSQLVFHVDEVIAYLSQIVTLEPGDLIFTGTPPGVGMARKPPVWLQPGDVVEVEIDGLGVLRNPVARH
jgi:2-keto-4-pentenoate hydratase/2-oxohepta-3-ene-1,7-dioic acid hydratase in catechol pathway